MIRWELILLTVILSDISGGIFKGFWLAIAAAILIKDFYKVMDKFEPRDPNPAISEFVNDSEGDSMAWSEDIKPDKAPRKRSRKAKK